MALNDISFVKGAGGLGRALPGEDHYSGIAFYSASYPSGFSSGAPIKQVFSVEDAEDLGITDDYSDETKPRGTYLITTEGSEGDTLQIVITEPLPNGETQEVDLGTYTVPAGTDEDSIAEQGAAIAAMINDGTNTHGYSASFATATLTIIGREGLGVSLNTGTPIEVTVTGDFAGTLTQPATATVGVASKLAMWHYQISEFFRLAPKGVLYVGFFAVPGTYTYTELTTMQTFANGKIRQWGVWADARVFTAADLTTIDAVCNTNDDAHKPVQALYAANMKTITDLTALTDLNSLQANKVSAVIAQDGAGTGATLYVTHGKSIPALGAALGTVAAAKVSEDIAWIGKFNITDGTELDTIAMANGQLLTALSDGLVAQLDQYRYIFLIKKTGYTGSFWNDSHCAVSAASDYAYIENNRTIDKAIRGIYTALLPSLNAPITLNSDGTIADVSIAALESAGRPGLDAMVRDGELSGYTFTIDPVQNVQTTETLVVSVALLGQAVARNYQINIGFALSL